MKRLKKCSVPNCKDLHSKRHRFPCIKETEMFQLWLYKINNPALMNLEFSVIYSSYRVCGQHFEDSFKSYGTRKGLLRNAFPSLHLPEEEIDDTLVPSTSRNEGKEVVASGPKQNILKTLLESANISNETPTSYGTATRENVSDDGQVMLLEDSDRDIAVETSTSFSIATREKVSDVGQIMLLEDSDRDIADETSTNYSTTTKDVGHSICCSCKDRVATCPICRSEFSKTRNYTLEKLTSKVNYPCRNREIGCNFVTTTDKIRNHEAVCDLTDIPCLLGCGYKSMRPKMYGHILEKHPHQLLPLDVNLKQDMSGKTYAHYVLHSNGELFRFSLSLNGEFKFNIQHWGTIDEKPKYRYQMEFVDPTSNGRSLSMSFFCQALTEQTILAYKTATALPWELLKPFYDLKYINYKISVFKI